MNFKEKISIYYTSLTPTEKRICTKILDHPEIIIEHSIIEAGDLCKTSKSAMLRFAKKLQYRGYSEFKYAIEEYKNSLNKPIINQNQSMLYYVSQSFQLTINALGNLDFDSQLKQLVQLFDTYSYVKVLGIGNSAFCAKQLVYSLYSHNRFFESVTDDVQFMYLENCIDKNHLLIVFSVSGSEETYLQLLKKAKAKGSFVVLISMNQDTSLKKYSQVNFFLPSNVAPLDNSKVLKQLDNRTTFYFFAEIISYYYGLYLENK